MMGESREEIEKKLQQMTGLTKKELRAVLQDAVLTSWDNDTDTFRAMGINVSSPLENPAVIEIMNAQYRKSLGELRNLTRTTMNQSQTDLINMLDEADMRVAASVQSYSAAVCDILDRYAGRGIEVLYPTGTKRTLEAAVLCCVRTSMAQMAAKVTLEYVKQAGTNLIITSAHTGARFTEHDEPANHMSWQGRVFYISDTDLAKHTTVKDKFEESGAAAGGSRNSGNYPDFIKSTGYGSGEGLCGYNCRHSFGPYDERIGNRWRDKDGNLIDGAGNRIDDEESKQKYRNSQKLRAMERAIRKTKRELLTKQAEINSVAETDVKSILQEDYDKLAYRLRQQNKAFNEFVEANDLRKQYERIKVSGFKRKQSAKANGAATRYENKQSGLHREENKPHEATDFQNVMNDENVGGSRFIGTNTIFEQKSPLEKCTIAKDLTEKYVKRESKWKGIVKMDDEKCKRDRIAGRKEWNCTILVNSKTQPKTYIHEMLHSRSGSYLNPVSYLPYRKMEEATTEFLAREICKREGISFGYKARLDVDALIKINGIIKIEKSNFDFAQMLYNKDIQNRYIWLENKVKRHLLNNGMEKKEELEQCLEVLKR
ncbi:MAG: phage minor capsid protein, partial [Lachnospiraceae bacterium]|nr:phage minor capsid protein [Lachnospiraceae bacterium]